jgi:hypothetical protein
MKIENKEMENIVPSAQSSAKQQIVDDIRNHVQVLSDAWSGSPEELEQEFRRLRLLLGYQIALACPSSAIASIVQHNVEQMGAGAKLSSRINLPSALGEKVKAAAKTIGSTQDDVVATIVSQNLAQFIEGTKDRKEAEREDVIDS